MKNLTFFFKKIFIAGLCLSLSCTGVGAAFAVTEINNEQKILDDIQHRAFMFLWREANPTNGLVKDRAGSFEPDSHTVASIASVGFALAAIPIGVERGWVSKREARKRVINSLRFFLREAENERGFFYHFLGMNTGRRAWKCEISSIDTAILLAGAIVVREYFNNRMISDYVEQIYNRIDFKWMLNGGKTLSMGWKPRDGFIQHRWNDYNEGILATLLAMASETNPVPKETWDYIKRRKGVYDRIVVIQSPPLFTHQYPQLFFDLRNKHDEYADYFQNSVNATLTNRRFCLNEGAKYETFRQGYWGLTACDGPYGYKAYGAEPGGALTDGTVAPTAAITSIMFTPEKSLEFIKHIYKNEKEWLWGRYGFTDSFNMKPKWRSEDIIGIDVGAILLGIENYRTGLIWDLFSKSKESKKALRLAGFKSGRREIVLEKPPVYSAKKMSDTLEWDRLPIIHLTEVRFLELGELANYEDLDIKLQFAWDSEYLYFRARVADDETVSSKGGQYIWKNDCLEIFVNPDGEGLVWGNSKDFQIGFSPTKNMDGTKVWSWFQKLNPFKENTVHTDFEKTQNGYVIKGKIRWDFLGIEPKKGDVISLSPAFHDIDYDKSEKKYTWHFQSENGSFNLGKVILN